MKAPSTSRLRLRVIPGARNAGVVGRYGEAWKLRVTAAPEQGKANSAVLELLADTLAVPAASLRLVAGHASRDKTVEVSGLAADEAERRLAR
jgi:uncharacterized protein YggU (UPF0235/DUF167 family)